MYLYKWAIALRLAKLAKLIDQSEVFVTPGQVYFKQFFRPSDDFEWRLSCNSRAEPNNLRKISRKTVEPERRQRSSQATQRPGQIWSLKTKTYTKT